MESHLRYRPYKCSCCEFCHRKNIFVSVHIKNVHLGVGEVLFEPNNKMKEKYFFFNFIIKLLLIF